MLITEIFRSIQGESSYAGLPCIFVRLTGCNLRCTWCDTAYSFYGGTKLRVDEVVARVEELAVAQPLPAVQDDSTKVATGAGAASKNTAQSGCATHRISLVEITGGEPLLQDEMYPLIERLRAGGFTVLVETSGERDLSRLPGHVVKIVDVKCPDSGEANTFHLANLELLGPQDEVKFVIASRRDYEFARDFAAQHRLAERVHQVLFSPVMADPEGKWGEMDRRALAEWILADRLPVRLGMQLHKFIWDPATRGV
jgi:7-carboxy-7-deazaguanine synthase